ASATLATAGTKTWDGRHDTSQIEVTVVYFVPADRQPLPDWRDRVAYFCRRLELFHQREFDGQSQLTTVLHAEPFVSAMETESLRAGDANAIYHRTLGEVDSNLNFASEPAAAFRILLVLSDINWRPLDDFYRVRPENDELVFEGIFNDGQHFPGARSGGARAAYLADRGVGWGLVSADGWRVPYRGSDCVVYHEGCGHTVGLPHPEPGDASVMSLGQYRGWISESWLDKEQKIRLGWEPPAGDTDERSSLLDLFTRFRALAEPAAPQPDQDVNLVFDWPEGAEVKALRIRLQTAIESPWIEVPVGSLEVTPATVSIGSFDRETPVSYRVDAELSDGETVELWGYFQVRKDAQQNPRPLQLSADLHGAATDRQASLRSYESAGDAVDLLAQVKLEDAFAVGRWTKENGVLQSPKQYGARLELPYTPPPEYRLIIVAEPLDEPNALLLGQRSGEHRFAALFGFKQGTGRLSAIENIDGRNVGNETTYTGDLFKPHQLSQVIVEVTRAGVQMSVDGRRIVDWQGDSKRLSLSDYWSTPDKTRLTLGAYDCGYRFHRITIEPIRSQRDE
ncbi:MAG: hypothetical protein ACO1RT_13040, partial [Planctomycetaceae bacterium]